MTCEVGGCMFLPLCETCEQAEIMAAAKHLRNESVYSPLAARWERGGARLVPSEIQEYVEQVLAHVAGGSSSSLTPGAGEASGKSSDGGGNREHLSSAKAAATTSPEAREQNVLRVLAAMIGKPLGRIAP